MPICKGMDNTKDAKEAIFARTKTGVAAALRAGHLATAADFNGSINAWIDDSNDYRCEAMRNMRTIEQKKFNSMKEVTDWYMEWLKKIA